MRDRSLTIVKSFDRKIASLEAQLGRKDGYDHDGSESAQIRSELRKMKVKRTHIVKHPEAYSMLLLINIGKFLLTVLLHVSSGQCVY